MNALASDDIEVRERATGALKNMGPRIRPVLERELAKATEEEIRTRLRSVIDCLSRPAFELVKEIDFAAGWSARLSAWSPDGKRVAIGGGLGGTVVLIYDTATWKEAARVDAKSLALGIGYSPDGKLLAVRTPREITVLSAEDY